ncbi:hypothetical protein PTI98_005645 [Pleurotus ostreatus]|nr:hypothetical protein PTI98_005645 [Pleurotus ostreatus]
MCAAMCDVRSFCYTLYQATVHHSPFHHSPPSTIPHFPSHPPHPLPRRVPPTIYACSNILSSALHFLVTFPFPFLPFSLFLLSSLSLFLSPHSSLSLSLSLSLLSLSLSRARALLASRSAYIQSCTLI